MTRVAYLVSDYFAPSHTFVRREVAALRKAGLQITPFSIQASGGDGEAEAVLKRPSLEYPLALIQALASQPLQFVLCWWISIQHRPPGLRALAWSQFHFVEAIMLARLIKASRCTRLHNHFANSAAVVGMIAAKFLKIPWSFTLHGISETDYPAGMLLREKLEHADFVACASYFMQAQAMRSVDFGHWSKMHIVRCGVNLSTMLSGISGDGQSDHDRPVKIICVGRLSAEKGYFGLVKVLAQLAADGHEFDTTIVGDGPSAAAIHAKVAALALHDKIHFTGGLSETETLAEISRSDIMVLPSLMEGLPVVLIEALAMRKAVVASQVAGIPELIIQGQTGLLFTPSNWDDLERQLHNLMADPVLRKKLGAEGFRKVKSEFSSERAADILSSLFQAKSD